MSAKIYNRQIRKTTTCPICGREISLNNLSKHLNGHQQHPERYKEGGFNSTYLDYHRYGKEKALINLECLYCHRVDKNNGSAAKHQRYCEKNPNRLIKEKHVHIAWNKGLTAWNKGLTKEVDARVAKNSASRKKYYKTHNGPFKGHHHTEEYKEKLRQVALKEGLGGHCYRKSILKDNVILESSYEKITADSLDENNVVWSRPGRFKYKDMKGIKHTYTPDFYLPEYNVYLDPKNDYLINNINPGLGFKDVDKIRWVEKQNKIRIIILDKNHLRWPNIQKLI